MSAVRVVFVRSPTEQRIYVDEKLAFQGRWLTFQALINVLKMMDIENVEFEEHELSPHH